MLASSIKYGLSVIVFVLQDIEQFINNSSHGAIYLTFGSTIKMDTFPLWIQEAVVEALSELPYRVLWKYESKYVGNLTKNVMIKNWFSQRDILSNYIILKEHVEEPI